VREILVDTNVLVSFLTDRDEGQRRKASALFQGAAEREHTLVLHTISIVEMAYVLLQFYKQEASQVAETLADLLAMPGVLTAGEVSWSLVLERWPKTIGSLGDAMVAAAAIQGRYDAVATFDNTLRKKLTRQGSVSYWSD
jgi:predicted nucleic acid-binding protein